MGPFCSGGPLWLSLWWRFFLIHLVKLYVFFSGQRLKVRLRKYCFLQTFISMDIFPQTFVHTSLICTCSATWHFPQDFQFRNFPVLWHCLEDSKLRISLLRKLTVWGISYCAKIRVLFLGQLLSLIIYHIQ